MCVWGGGATAGVLGGGSDISEFGAPVLTALSPAQDYKNLQDIIAILGMDELSEEDKMTDPSLFRAGLQELAGYHCHPGDGRVERGGQDDRGARAQGPEVHVPGAQPLQILLSYPDHPVDFQPSEPSSRFVHFHLKLEPC